MLAAMDDAIVTQLPGQTVSRESAPYPVTRPLLVTPYGNAQRLRRSTPTVGCQPPRKPMEEGVPYRDAVDLLNADH